MKQGTFKEFMEEYYKKPYDQIPKKELMEHAREIFGFGLSKDDLNDDGSDLDQLNEIMRGWHMKTIFKTYAIDNADIVRMSAQGHTEKESLEFCKMDLINDRANKEIKDYWSLQNFRFETIIVDNK